MTSNLILHFLDLLVSTMILVVAIVRNSMEVSNKSRWIVTFVAVFNLACAIWITIMYIFYLFTGSIWV